MKAIYAGSFDPLTNGHLFLIEETSKMFDKIFVLYATNTSKKRHTDEVDSINKLKKLLKDKEINNVEVLKYDGLVADFARENNCNYLIRGLRNTSDYLYEENIAKINSELNPNLNTIYIRANNDTISSSLIRELKSYGKDISKYVPFEIIWKD